MAFCDIVLDTLEVLMNHDLYRAHDRGIVYAGRDKSPRWNSCVIIVACSLLDKLSKQLQRGETSFGYETTLQKCRRVRYISLYAS